MVTFKLLTPALLFEFYFIFFFLNFNSSDQLLAKYIFLRGHLKLNLHELHLSFP